MTKNETEEGRAINIVFDGPPNQGSGRLVRVETEDGRSVAVETMGQREDGLWALRVTELPAKVKKPIIIHKLPVNTLVEVWNNDHTDVHEKRYWKCRMGEQAECFNAGTTSQTETASSFWSNYRILENPWLPWFGEDCPVAPWVKVMVQRYGERCTPSTAIEARHLPWSYSYYPKDDDVTSFQIVEQEVPKW